MSEKKNAVTTHDDQNKKEGLIKSNNKKKDY